MSFSKDNYVSKSFHRDFKNIMPDADFEFDTNKGTFKNPETQLAFKAYERAFTYAHNTARKEIDAVNSAKASSKIFVVTKSTENGNFVFIRKPYQHHTFGAAIIDAQDKHARHGEPFHVFACVSTFSNKTVRNASCKQQNTAVDLLETTSEAPQATS